MRLCNYIVITKTCGILLLVCFFTRERVMFGLTLRWSLKKLLVFFLIMRLPLYVHFAILSQWQFRPIRGQLLSAMLSYHVLFTDR